MLSILVAFAVRCLLVGLFLPFSALDKVLNFGDAVDQATQAIAHASGDTAAAGRPCHA